MIVEISFLLGSPREECLLNSVRSRPIGRHHERSLLLILHNSSDFPIEQNSKYVNSVKQLP